MSKINYNLTQIRGVVFDVDGVLSPSVVPMDTNGVPQRMSNLRDGYALQLAAKSGLHMAIITGADTEAVVKRFNGLGISDVYIKAGDKLSILNEWMSAHSLKRDEVAFCGDDIPDIECMKHVGLPVAPGDAAVDVLDVAEYVTQANGGYGVARELLEEILKAKGAWPLKAKAFGK